MPVLVGRGGKSRRVDPGTLVHMVYNRKGTPGAQARTLNAVGTQILEDTAHKFLQVFTRFYADKVLHIFGDCRRLAICMGGSTFNGEETYFFIVYSRSKGQMAVLRPQASGLALTNVGGGGG